ncbi:hypothetical protein AB0E63_33570 [Kribbella sp. NPDC026596]|uniref:hypothetical protein n=1 Tax=Kribbella sp. NPDC026596 TaxID=3155122 RepID=UPI0034010842
MSHADRIATVNGDSERQVQLLVIYACPPVQEPLRLRHSWPFEEGLRRIATELAQRVQRPAAIRRLAALAPGERALVVTCTTDDATVIATDDALHQLDDGSGPWTRWPWEQLTAVTWDSATKTLTMTGQQPVLPGQFHLRLAAPGPLVTLARERIAFTTSFRTRVQLRAGDAVGIVVRRHPRTDRHDWFIYPGPSVDPDDSVVRAELNAVISQLRASTGL